MGQSKSSNPFNASVPVPAVQSNRSVSYQISQNLPNFTISTKFYNFDQISLQIFPSLRSASVTAVRKFHRRVHPPTWTQRKSHRFGQGAHVGGAKIERDPAELVLEEI